jgi:predicted Holliday junction resolvase-like endonuclease
MDHKPLFTFDWTINLGHLVSIAFFILGGIAAWYDVKSEVKVHDVKIQTLFEADISQNLQREKLASEIKESFRDSKNEIKQEIRDLRNDLVKKPSVAR